jgi:hypothetical protein
MRLTQTTANYHKWNTIVTVVWGSACIGTLAGSPAHGDIIESVTEDIDQARGREFANSKGGPDNNQLTNTDERVRAGKTAFKHWVNTKGERSELAMQRTKIGGTYWYGWSMMLPEDFDHRGSDTIVMQLASWPTPRNGKFPHSANGPYLEIQPDGRMIMHLQHKGQDTDMVCDDFVVAEDVARLKGKWLDFVMHARWTGEKDGHFKLWLKVDDNNYLQKVDYKGPTWWNDEDTGPYFKMGAYMGEPGWKGPASRTVYTDEYRLGDGASSFDEVAPGASERREEACQGGLEYRLYRSLLNDQDIPILVSRRPTITARQSGDFRLSTTSTARAAAAPPANGTGSTRRSSTRWSRSACLP